MARPSALDRLPERRASDAVGRRRAVRLAALIGLGFALAACGRRGRLETPPDADPKAPRTYPTQ